MRKIDDYLIQKWLFDEAEGKFEIDLAESGIQFHNIKDLDINDNCDLNYSLDRGNKKLREIIARQYGVRDSNVMITNGSQEALFLFYQTILKKDDHVITFIPGWQQSWSVPHNIGCNVTKIKLVIGDKNKFDFAKLKKSINRKTKLIIFNSPNNPTGLKLTTEEWIKVRNLVKNKEIIILNDEVYINDFKESVINIIPNSFSVSSLSKLYGFPGLRIGWLVGPRGVVDSIINFKRYTTVSNSSLCEFLALQVFKKRNKYVKEYKIITNQGLQILKKWIKNKREFELINPNNTPFAYIKLNLKMSSLSFCRGLLRSQKVLLMPAEVFEDKKAFRISFGRPADILKEGLRRIDKFIKLV